jgi:hypothetical protein
VAGRSAFPHPFDDHFISPFQRRMLCLGGRGAGMRLFLVFLGGMGGLAGGELSDELSGV